MVDASYFIEYEIGQSNWGETFAVSHKATGQKRLLKTVKKHHGGYSQSAAIEDQRRRDLDRLASVRHPHINPLLEWHERDDEYALIFEYHPGGELQDFIEKLSKGRNWVNENTIALYTRQILLALSHIHQGDIQHGCLSGSTTVLSSKLPDAVARITDTGLSGIFDPNCELVLKNPTCYNSYHQLSNHVSLKADDLWALGVLCYYMLVGKMPFGAGSSNPKPDHVANLNGPHGSKNTRNPSTTDSIGAMLFSAIAGTASSSSAGRNHSHEGQGGTLSIAYGELNKDEYDRYDFEELRSDRIAFYEDDGWDLRSKASRDFIRALLQVNPKERPTACQCLFHEWIDGFGKEHYKIPEELKPKANEKHLAKSRPLEKALTVVVLLLSFSRLPPGVFEEIRKAHNSKDTDADGFIYVSDAAELLRKFTKKSRSECIQMLMEIDSCRCFDIVAFTVAVVLCEYTEVQSGEPLPVMFERCSMELFKEYSRDGAKTSTASLLKRCEQGNLARQFQQFCHLRFGDMLKGLPNGECGFEEFSDFFLSADGRGLPCYAYLNDRDESHDAYCKWDLDSQSIFTKLTSWIPQAKQATSFLTTKCGVIKTKARYPSPDAFTPVQTVYSTEGSIAHGAGSRIGATNSYYSGTHGSYKGATNSYGGEYNSRKNMGEY